MRGNMRPGMTTHTKSLIPTTKNVQLTFQKSTGVLMSTGDLSLQLFFLCFGLGDVNSLGHGAPFKNRHYYVINGRFSIHSLLSLRLGFPNE